MRFFAENAYSSEGLGLLVFSIIVVMSIITRLVFKVGQWGHVLAVQFAAAAIFGYTAYLTDSLVNGLPLRYQASGCLASVLVAWAFMVLFQGEPTESSVHAVKSSDVSITPKH